MKEKLARDSFGLSSSFHAVTSLRVDIALSAPLAPGVYDDPDLLGVTCSVLGMPNSPTPSGFPGFDLQRSITAADFCAQGSSLQFAISPGVDLADGLQGAELAGPGAGPVFMFNGREVGTGRYHPPLLALFADGYGRIQNADNMGASIRPCSRRSTCISATNTSSR